MTVVSELFAVLGIDFDKDSAKRAETGLEAVRSMALKLVATFSAISLGRKLVGIFEDTVDAADQARHAAERVGASVEAYQQLQIAGQLAGVEAGQLETALERLGRTAAEAATGGHEQAKAFGAIGLSVRGVGGHLKPTDQLFGELADKLKKIPDAGRRTQVAFQLMGRGAGPLIPLLLKGKDGMQELMDAARETGAVISEQTVADVKLLSRETSLLKLNFIGIGRTISAALVPYVGGLVKYLRELFHANRALVDEKVHEAIDLLTRAFQWAVREGAEFIRTVKFAIDNLHGLEILGAIAAYLVAMWLAPIAPILAVIALVYAFLQDLQSADSTLRKIFHLLEQPKTGKEHWLLATARDIVMYLEKALELLGILDARQKPVLGDGGIRHNTQFKNTRFSTDTRGVTPRLPSNKLVIGAESGIEGAGEAIARKSAAMVVEPGGGTMDIARRALAPPMHQLSLSDGDVLHTGDVIANVTVNAPGATKEDAKAIADTVDDRLRQKLGDAHRNLAASGAE